VLLTEVDIGRLAQAMELSEREFIGRYTVLARHRQGLSLADGPDGACVFLEGHRCRVYAARPEQCRTFPVEWFVPGCPATQEIRKMDERAGP
jgi:uncharacterized protein